MKKIILIFILFNLSYSSEYQKLLKKATKFYINHQYDKAFKIWQTIYKQKKTPTVVNNIAMAYYNGIGVLPDQAKAVSILENYLKKHHNPKLMVTLALMYYQGYINNFTHEINIKRKTAYQLLKKAASEGNKTAKKLLKKLYNEKK
jgi:TPR repeat protein